MTTARGETYDMTEDFFPLFSRFSGWENIGDALGAGKEVPARTPGARV